VRAPPIGTRACARMVSLRPPQRAGARPPPQATQATPESPNPGRFACRCRYLARHP